MNKSCLACLCAGIWNLATAIAGQLVHERGLAGLSLLAAAVAFLFACHEYKDPKP